MTNAVFARHRYSIFTVFTCNSYFAVCTIRSVWTCNGNAILTIFADFHLISIDRISSNCFGSNAIGLKVLSHFNSNITIFGYCFDIFAGIIAIGPLSFTFDGNLLT